MLWLLFRIMHSRLLWRVLLALAVATAVFWATYVAVAAVILLIAGTTAAESDLTALNHVAAPVATLVTIATLILGVVVLAIRRVRRRRESPVYGDGFQHVTPVYEEPQFRGPSRNAVVRDNDSDGMQVDAEAVTTEAERILREHSGG